MGGSESRDSRSESDEEGGESSNQRNTGVGANLGTALAVGGAIAAAGLLAWGGASRAVTDSSDHQQREDNNSISISQVSHRNIANGSADPNRWGESAPARFKLNSDGSFNISRSAIGGLIRNSQGELILAYGEPVTTADIVETEFLAVLKGIEYAVDQKIQDIYIETDNSSVARILSTMVCKPKYQYLLDSTEILLEKFRSFKIADPIRRELNSCADLMAKNAVRDQKMVYWAADDPRIPEALHTLIRKDLDRELSVEK